jgi:hypothetical protein
VIQRDLLGATRAAMDGFGTISFGAPVIQHRAHIVSVVELPRCAASRPRRCQ